MQAWAAHMCRQHSKRQQQQQLLAVRSVCLKNEAWQAWKHDFLPSARHKRRAAALAGAHWRQTTLRASLLGWIEVGTCYACCAVICHSMLCWADHRLQAEADFAKMCEDLGRLGQAPLFFQCARLGWGVRYPTCSPTASRQTAVSLFFLVQADKLYFGHKLRASSPRQKLQVSCVCSMHCCKASTSS